MTTEYDHSRDARRSIRTRVHDITQVQQDAGAKPRPRRDKSRAGFRFQLASRSSTMLKFLITSLFGLVLAVPALAKPAGVYPVSCDNLWVAVKDMLDNPSNYAVESMDDAGQRASFIIVGSTPHYTQRVALSVKDGGCLANATIYEIGADNDEWRLFHHRLAKSVVKLQATKPNVGSAATGLQ